MSTVVAVIATVVALAVGAAAWRRERSISTRLGALVRDDGHLGERSRDAVERVERRINIDRVEHDKVVRRGELIRKALDELPFGVLVIDDSDGSVIANAAAGRLGGSAAGNVLLSEVEKSLVRDVKAGGVTRRRLELVGPPRRVLDLEAFTMATGSVIVVLDHTEQSRLEAARTDFVANISHELRTPVGALALLAETLADEPDPVIARRLSERIVFEAQRVTRTTDDLIELTQIEGRPSRLFEEVSLLGLISEVIARVDAFATQRLVTVSSSVTDADGKIQGDERQLASALVNLVENAVKYSDAGSSIEVEVTTRTRADSDDELIAINVIDHGIGIPNAEVGRIFERFYRVDKARSRNTGGSGLGLSIVRHVADNHRGSITVVSNEGHGSTFTLTLPRRFSTGVPPS
jgi:two-component system, OmpR family, sensor histidine kinase SenX3